MYLAKIPDPHVWFRKREREFYHRSFLIHDQLFLTLMFDMFLRGPLPMHSASHVTLDWFDGVSLERHCHRMREVSKYYLPVAVERRNRVRQIVESILPLSCDIAVANIIAEYDIIDHEQAIIEHNDEDDNNEDNNDNDDDDSDDVDEPARKKERITHTEYSRTCFD